MKKSIISLVALLFLAVGFTSCEKKSEGLTKVTFYANIELEGDDYMIVAKGSAFTDPGFTATMNGQDVSKDVKVEGGVDTSVSGVYTIEYSIVNADGFPATASRTVVVLDPVDPVEGMWELDQAKSQRVYNGATAPYKGAFDFLIINNGDGTYFVEDLMAGWYAQGAGYGSNYAMQAIISIDDNGVISLEESYVPGWGDAADKLEDGMFDAANSTISYKLFYADVIEFDVEINKLDLGL